MLYHVPDRRCALSEMRRVLRPGGRLYAATNGRSRLREVDELMAKLGGYLPVEHSPDRFTLENCASQLSRCFSDLRLDRYEDSLVVTEAERVVDFVLSMNGRRRHPEGWRAAVRPLIERELSAQNAFRITKDAGIFECMRREPS